MIKETIIKIIEDITGLDGEYLNNNPELNLFENCILDSLSIVNLISEVEIRLNIKIDISKHKPEEFINISSLTNLFEKEKQNH